MHDPDRSPSPRILAIAALVCFVPVTASFAIAPGIWWINYPGILFHLALFLMVSRLEAPEWARAAGYGWLVLDVAAAVMTMDNVEHNIAYSERYGGHIFAGIWMATVSSRGSWPVRITGVLAGVLLFSYSFVARFVPPQALAASSPLILLWLGLIAWQNGVQRSGNKRAVARSTIPATVPDPDAVA